MKAQEQSHSRISATSIKRVNECAVCLLFYIQRASTNQDGKLPSKPEGLIITCEYSQEYQNSSQYLLVFGGLLYLGADLDMSWRDQFFSDTVEHLFSKPTISLVSLEDNTKN